MLNKMNFQSNIGNNPKWELKFSSIYYVHDSMLVKNLELIFITQFSLLHTSLIDT
jgi:hypothetical protein